MTEREALKLALEALQKIYIAPEHEEYIRVWWPACEQAITAIKEALAQPEPVAWLITDEKINSIQVNSIQRLIDRAKHAHMTDIKLRINGQDEWYEADWLKHLTRTTPPQRTWTGLTDEERKDTLQSVNTGFVVDASVVALAIEAKLKEKNT